MGGLISIVFTSFNHREFLVQALESILNQTYRNFELIIVDDCSTDGSQEVIMGFYHRYPQQIKLHLLSQNTGSYVKASNYGASHASGQYILFAQCDDYSEPTQLEELSKRLFSNSNAGVSFSSSRLVNEKGISLGSDFDYRSYSFRKSCKSETLIRGKKMFQFLTHSCVIPNLSAALINRDLFVSIGGFSENFIMAADWDLWFKLAARTDFYYIPEHLNNFRQHGTTIRKNTKLAKQITEIYSLFYYHINENAASFISSLRFRINAARIWMGYLIEDRKSFAATFSGLVKELSSYDRLIYVYILCGFFSIIPEVLKISYRKVFYLTKHANN